MLSLVELRIFRINLIELSVKAINFFKKKLNRRFGLSQFNQQKRQDSLWSNLGSGRGRSFRQVNPPGECRSNMPGRQRVNGVLKSRYGQGSSISGSPPDDLRRIRVN